MGNLFERFCAWFEKMTCKMGMHDWHGELIDGMVFEKCSLCGELEPFEG